MSTSSHMNNVMTASQTPFSTLRISPVGFELHLGTMGILALYNSGPAPTVLWKYHRLHMG